MKFSLSELGIHWSEKASIAILAGLICGDPILISSEYGEGKTYAVRQLAKFLRLRFGEVDASTAQFEEFIGYPMLDAEKGKATYITTPLSLMDKQMVLIDEINRARPANTNKFLQIIRSRKVMGMDTDIVFVIAAMNPMSTSNGVHELTGAILDRFGWFIRIENSIKDLDIARKVTDTMSEDDAPALDFWRNNGKRVKRSQRSVELLPLEQRVLEEKFSKLMFRAREMYDEVENKYGKAISAYVTDFAYFMSEQVNLSGRRRRLLRSVVISYLAMHSVFEGLENIDLNSDLVFDAITLGLPIDELKINMTKLQVAHQRAYSQATSMLISKTAPDMIRSLLKPDLHHILSLSIIGQLSREEDKFKKTANVLALATLAGMGKLGKIQADKVAETVLDTLYHRNAGIRGASLKDLYAVHSKQAGGLMALALNHLIDDENDSHEINAKRLASALKPFLPLLREVNCNVRAS